MSHRYTRPYCYNWNTATAGTGSSVTTYGINASGSICPKGWKLPSGGVSGSDFEKLVNAYGGNNEAGAQALRASPIPGFMHAGCIAYTNGSLVAQNNTDITDPLRLVALRLLMACIFYSLRLNQMMGVIGSMVIQ